MFLGIVEIAGYMGRLQEGFSEIGIESTFVNVGSDAFQYSEKRCGHLCNIAQRLHRTKKLFGIAPVSALCNCALFLIRMPLFLESILRYDAFVFGFGMSFFFLLELPIYRYLRKRLIFLFFGSDGRPMFLNGSAASNTRGIPVKRCLEIARKQKKRIRRIERFADVIITHPPSAQFHEKHFVPFLKLGFPCITSSMKPEIRGAASGEVRILHAPSFPECKGTEHIRGIIQRLQDRGLKIDYRELVGRPNKAVLKELEQCDFVIDEIYSDTLLAGFSTEAASYGKPAVIGSYADVQDMGLSTKDPYPPSLFVKPDEVEAAVSALTLNADLRIELGAKAYDFVRSEWSPARVAERLLRIIHGRIPKDWLYDPQTITYSSGWGFERSKQQKYFQQILQQYSITALRLADKPELEKKLGRLATEIIGASGYRVGLI